MVLSVKQGKTIRLPAEFFSGDKPADPKDPRVTITSPADVIVVKDAAPDRDALGIYHFDYAVGPDAPVGGWKATWSATVDGKDVGGEDTFEVLPSASEASTATAEASTETAEPTAPLHVHGGTPGAKKGGRRTGSKRRRVITAIAVVIALGLVGMYSLRDEAVPPEDALRQGLTVHRAGNIDEARNLYEQVLESDPDNKYAHFNLGVMDQEEGRTADAESHYQRALESDPEFTPAMFNLAIAYETSEKNTDAEDLYREIISLQPNHAAAHLNLGFLLIRKLNNRPEGESLLRRAAELDPRLATRVPAEIRRPTAQPSAPVA